MNRTLQDIKNSTSLNNLKKGKPLGQIATLLILIITALLIFVLIVANLGQISSYATRLSNAADAASLYLASQVGTKANQISQSLMKSCGNPEKCCKKTGLLSVILAIIIAIVAIVISYFVPPLAPLMFTVGTGAITAIGAAIIVGAGIVGGAIGGTIGGAIAGTGALQGAIQGAAVGAAIGGGIAGGYGAAGWAFGGTATALVEGGLLTAAAFSTTAAIVGASLGVTIAAASSIYNAYVADAMTASSMAAAAKALNGLPEYQRIRESVFLQALSQTIDDPNKVADSIDSDGDGDTTELVPNFQVCWDKRITWLKSNIKPDVSAAMNAISQFLNGPVATFQQAIKNFKTSTTSTPVEGEYGVINYVKGGLLELLLGLESAGYDVSFFQPTSSTLDAWKQWDPNQCPNQNSNCLPPSLTTHDEFYETIAELDDFNASIDELRSLKLEDLVYSWQYWTSLFYEPPPNEGADYYSSFGEMINGESQPLRLGLRGWINEIEGIRRRLPACILSPCGGEDGVINQCISNPPCQGLSSNPNFGTIDTDFDDEFQIAKDAINKFIAQAEDFRLACQAFYNTIKNLMSGIELPFNACGLSGINPVTYSWLDSRGNHSITVQIMPFKMPEVRTKKYGNWLKGKKCMELDPTEDNVTVTIERRDPARVGVGILGLWNPSGGGSPAGVIRRRSTARYRGVVGSGFVKIVGR